MAIVSSCLCGSAGAVTRYLVGNADPVTLTNLRKSIGFLCVLPAVAGRWRSSLDTGTATDDAAPGRGHGIWIAATDRRVTVG